MSVVGSLVPSFYMYLFSSQLLLKYDIRFVVKIIRFFTLCFKFKVTPDTAQPISKLTLLEDKLISTHYMVL